MKLQFFGQNMAKIILIQIHKLQSQEVPFQSYIFVFLYISKAAESRCTICLITELMKLMTRKVVLRWKNNTYLPASISLSNIVAALQALRIDSFDQKGRFQWDGSSTLLYLVSQRTTLEGVVQMYTNVTTTSRGKGAHLDFIDVFQRLSIWLGFKPGNFWWGLGNVFFVSQRQKENKMKRNIQFHAILKNLDWSWIDSLRFCTNVD